MKKLILITVLGLACISGWAQGTLNFASAGAGVVFRVTNSVGVLAGGSGYLADLYYGAAGVTESSLQPLNLPATFNSGAQAGFFTGGARTVPGFAGGSTITAQVRVWDAADGATWAAAAAAAAAGSPTAEIG